tara:strand:- start:989 stop:1327 length:339 start_codon:yes stop_codon:yes gene_type:complete
MTSSNNWERQVSQARKVPITTMCKHLNVQLKKASNGTDGESWVGVCPLCRDDPYLPRLRVNPQGGSGTGRYYCPDCSSAGDSLGLYMAVKRVGFSEAVREISDVLNSAKEGL